jgi:hypothetical protein
MAGSDTMVREFEPNEISPLVWLTHAIWHLRYSKSDEADQGAIAIMQNLIVQIYHNGR